MKKFYTQKQLSTFKNFKNNVLNEKKGVARVLDKRSEQKEFYEILKKHKDGGIDSREMRSIIGSLYQRTDDHIDREEARRLAREFIGGSRYMLKAKDRRENILRSRNNIRTDLKNNSNNNLISDINSQMKPRKTTGYSGIKLVR